MISTTRLDFARINMIEEDSLQPYSLVVAYLSSGESNQMGRNRVAEMEKIDAHFNGF